MDLPAEFYLQTMKEVFHEFSLAKDQFVSIGINYSIFFNGLGIEGENDDIAAVGQTKAALSLCKNIPASKKKYHLQKGVGHYGALLAVNLDKR
jgi:poly(3-hydroxybutyrate) depolymerase